MDKIIVACALMMLGGAVAQSPGNAHAALALDRRYDAAKAAANAAQLPGNSWESIMKLPQLMGGGWSGGVQALARGIVLSDIHYPPFKPQYLAQSKAAVAAIAAGKSDFLDATCVPWGMPRLVYHLYSPTFLEEPGLIVIIGPSNRAVWMDGRNHPTQLTDPNALVELNSTGDSIGHWEGSTLIVDTVGVNPRVELFYGVPNGGGMHITESYHLTGPNSMRLQTTVEDPLVLEKPWVFTQNFIRMDSPSVVQDDCYPADDREVNDSSGGLKMDLAPPGGYPPGVSNK